MLSDPPAVDTFSATTFDAVPMLEPSEETPTNPCPGGAYTPASEYVRWILNAKIDSADPDNDPEHNRQTQKIDLKPKKKTHEDRREERPASNR